MLRGEGDVRHVNALKLSGVITYVGLIVAIFLIHRTDTAVALLFVHAVAQVIDSAGKLPRMYSDRMGFG